jgi:hypothetical protein
MLVGGIALRAPVRVAAGKKPEDPYAMLEARFTPRTVFMDIASADATLAARAASYVERVYAIDVSGRPVHSLRPRCNLRTVACDGVRIPVPEASVDIAWSGDFMDRLAPQAAAEHLQGVQRSLVNGGEYLFTTQQPVAEVRKRLFDAGFSVVRVALLSLLLKPLRITAIK